MKFDHKQKKVQQVVEGHTPDDDKVKDTCMRLITEQDFPGKKKSHMMEWLHENANDPDVLLAVAICLERGSQAIHMMTMLEAKTKEAMVAMDIHPDMPEEMKTAIREAKADAKKAKGTVASDTEILEEDTDDEFEKLKRKYA